MRSSCIGLCLSRAERREPDSDRDKLMTGPLTRSFNPSPLSLTGRTLSILGCFTNSLSVPEYHTSASGYTSFLCCRCRCYLSVIFLLICNEIQFYSIFTDRFGLQGCFSMNCPCQAAARARTAAFVRRPLSFESSSRERRKVRLSPTHTMSYSKHHKYRLAARRLTERSSSVFFELIIP